MPARVHLPRLCFYPPRQSGRVILGGVHVYCGPWDMKRNRPTPECAQRYEQVIAEWLSAGRRWPPPASAMDSVRTLSHAYFSHVQSYYTKGGRPTTSVQTNKTALELLDRAGFGDREPASFHPVDLEAFQVWLAADPAHRWSRSTINTFAGCVVRMFRWGVRKGVVPAETLTALDTVPGLRRGRRPAPHVDAPRESRRVQSVGDARIEAAMRHMAPHVRAMVEVQLFSGMRPHEVVSMRPCDVLATQDPDVWVYVPASHKTEHHGKARRILLGPRAMVALRPFLAGDPARACFVPAMASRLGPAGAGEAYSVAAYRRAITRACRRACREEAGVAYWRDVPPERRWTWSPNQLRHTAATRIAAAAAIEVARDALGHSSVTTTERYVDVLPARLVEAVRRLG